LKTLKCNLTFDRGADKFLNRVWHSKDCGAKRETFEGGQGMPIKNIPQETKKFEVEAYKRPKNLRELKKSHIPFSGSPLKHPYDSKKVILVPDPYSSTPFYYEFKSDDISFLEELPNMVNLEGETIRMARIWVKKMSVGMLCSPFLVEETKR
jgi:hypothetical protein